MTDDEWIACAVQDNIDFALKAGDLLDVKTTLCYEARMARCPVVFDNASEHSVYRNHPTPKIYGLQSYISVPIVRKDGTYSGTFAPSTRSRARCPTSAPSGCSSFSLS